MQVGRTTTWIVVGRGMGRDGPGYFLQLPLAMHTNLISEISYHLVVNHIAHEFGSKFDILQPRSTERTSDLLADNL